MTYSFQILVNKFGQSYIWSMNINGMLIGSPLLLETLTLLNVCSNKKDIWSKHFHLCSSDSVNLLQTFNSLRPSLGKPALITKASPGATAAWVSILVSSIMRKWIWRLKGAPGDHNIVGLQDVINNLQYKWVVCRRGNHTVIIPNQFIPINGFFKVRGWQKWATGKGQKSCFQINLWALKSKTLD